MNNLEKYNNVFVETFKINESDLATLKYQDIPAWDSVGHMGLVAFINFKSFNKYIVVFF